MVRLLFSEAATHPKGQAPAKLLSTAGISCAFMHAKYDGDLVLVLPAGMAPPGVRGKLVGAIIGTRKASQLWQRFVESRMKEGCPQLFLHPRRGIWSVVHGDDFLSVAEKGPTK